MSWKLRLKKFAAYEPPLRRCRQRGDGGNAKPVCSWKQQLDFTWAAKSVECGLGATIGYAKSCVKTVYCECHQALIGCGKSSWTFWFEFHLGAPSAVPNPALAEKTPICGAKNPETLAAHLDGSKKFAQSTDVWGHLRIQFAGAPTWAEPWTLYCVGANILSTFLAPFKKMTLCP
jgi:hypothetical protein